MLRRLGIGTCIEILIRVIPSLNEYGDEVDVYAIYVMERNRARLEDITD